LLNDGCAFVSDGDREPDADSVSTFMVMDASERVRCTAAPPGVAMVGVGASCVVEVGVGVESSRSKSRWLRRSETGLVTIVWGDGGY
jgi:hypothetical protein